MSDMLRNLNKDADLILTVKAALDEAREKLDPTSAELLAVYIIDNHFPANVDYACGCLGISPERYQEIQNL